MIRWELPRSRPQTRGASHAKALCHVVIVTRLSHAPMTKPIVMIADSYFMQGRITEGISGNGHAEKTHGFRGETRSELPRFLPQRINSCLIIQTIPEKPRYQLAV